MDSDKDHGHPHCLKFWFHMYGPHVDTLNVYKKYGGTLQKIWTRVGDNGDYWKAAQVDLTSNYKFQVFVDEKHSQEVFDVSQIKFLRLQKITMSCDLTYFDLLSY